MALLSQKKQVSRFEKQVSHFKMISDTHFTLIVPEKGEIENMRGLKNGSI